MIDKTTFPINRFWKDGDRDLIFGMRYFLVLLLLLPSIALPQFFNLGQNPTQTKWQQINTEHFQLIFTSEFEKPAQHVASMLEHIYGRGAKSMKAQPKKISIVLQSQFTESNGFVALAPRRSEFYGTPPQDNDVMAWLDLLAVHEYRHVLQLSKLRQGFSNIAYFLFGEAGQAAVAGITTPFWFLEGDATLTETVLTNAGRGRRPDFVMQYKTFLLERGGYNYDKASFGSFKDFVPSRYPLGYFMTTHVRRKNGTDSWSSIYDHVAQLPFVPFAFSRALKKETGFNTTTTYRNMNSELDSLWRQIERPTINYQKLNKRKNKVPTNYENIVSSNHVIIAVKSGYSHIPKIIQIDSSGREEKLATPGLFDNYNISANDNTVIWAEHKPDPRWAYRDFSVIMKYDIRRHKSIQLTKKTRLFAPSISPNGKYICAVEINLKNQYALVILDANTGKEIKRMENESNHFYKTPRWSDDGNRLVAIKLVEKGYQIVQIDFETLKEKAVMSPWRAIISQPVFHNEHIFFHAGKKGKDNIYVLEEKSTQIYQVTQSKNGAFSPTVKNDVLYFSNYSSEGYDLCSLKIDKATWVPLNQVEDESIHYYQPVVEQEYGKSIIDSIPDKQHEVQKYKKIPHSFNLHSWGPIVPNANEQSADIGFYLASQDVLSTTTLSAAYQANQRSNLDQYSFKLDYANFYPIISLEAKREFQSNAISNTYDLVLLEAGLSASLPLFLTRSKYNTSLFLQSGLFYQNYRYTGPGEINGEVTLSRSSMRFVKTLRRTKRDIVPRFGTDMTLIYEKSLSSSDNFETASLFDGQLFYARLTNYFPGIGRHHAISSRINYQNRSRGTTIAPFDAFIGVFNTEGTVVAVEELATATFNYYLPILYPDLPIGFIAYIQRIKLQPFYTHYFYDSSLYSSLNSNQSYGVTISADMNLLRYWFLFEIGLRVEYVPEYSSTFNSLSLTVNL